MDFAQINHYLQVERRSDSVGAWRKTLYFVISLTLCGVYLLLPIERGFPVVRLAGYPITISMIVSILCLIAIIVDSGGNIIFVAQKKYILSNMVFSVVLMVSSLISDNVTSGIFVVLFYIITFVVNFIIVFYIFVQGFRSWFVRILCATVFLASTIGVIEGIFRYYIPF